MDMMHSKACGRVSGDALHFRAAQPLHSDNPRRASEPIGLDTVRYSLSIYEWRVEVLMAEL